MTDKYTPEKVAELAAEARAWASLIGAEPRGARDVFSRLADALTAVSAERDEAWRIGAAQHGYNPTDDEQAGNFMRLANRADRAEAHRDRLHKAITEALEHIDHTIHVIDDEDGEPRMDDEADAYTEGATTAQHAIGVILRAALDKEGQRRGNQELHDND